MRQLEIIFAAPGAGAVDRDECEDALQQMLADMRLGEVTGAGRSLAGEEDLVVEVRNPRRAVAAIRRVLRRLGVPASTRIRYAGPPELILGVYDDDSPAALDRPAPAPRVRFRPRVGQVFGIPLDGGRWAYGRATPQKDFYEFFDVVTRERLSLPDLADAPTFRLPCFFDLGDREWSVLGVLPYDTYEPQPFRVAYALCPNVVGADGFLECGHPDPSRVLSESEVDRVPAISVAGAEVMQAMLERRFRGR